MGRLPALCDVDGVLAGFTPHILQAITGGRVTEADIVGWDIFNFVSDAEKARGIAMCNGYDFWSELPVIEGAQEGVEKLRRKFGRVRFLSSPWSSCDKWGHLRMQWLKKHFNAKSKDLIVDEEKMAVAGPFFLDDKGAHIENWHRVQRRPVRQRATRTGGLMPGGGDYSPAVVFDAPYNQDCQAPHRMMGWEDLDRVLEEVRTR